MGIEYGQGDQTLSRAAGIVAEARADLTAAGNQLTQRITAAQGQFVGQGGGSFFALHRAWTQRQQRIVAALDELSASLTQTERDNVSTDQGASADFARLSGRLGA